jgi:hypothetical protein
VSASFACAALRVPRTIQWRSTTISRAAICPRPSAEPVTKMRAIRKNINELHCAVFLAAHHRCLILSPSHYGKW